MPKDSVTSTKSRMSALFDNYFSSARQAETRMPAETPALELPAISADEITLASRMIELAELSGLDIRSIYCTKSGQPVGTREPRTIEILCRIYGVSDVAALWPMIEQAGIAPQWLRTDARSLDALIAHDPCGYFVYALSTIWLQVQPGYAADKQFWTSPARQRAFMLEKAAAYARVRTMPETLVRECNEMLLDFLRLISPRTMRHKLRLPNAESMADLITAENLTELPGTLSRIAHHVLTTARMTNLQSNTGIRLSQVTTITEIIAFQDALGAKNSAFAAQTRAKRARKENNEVTALFKQFGVNFLRMDARTEEYETQKAANPAMAGRTQRYSGIQRTLSTTEMLARAAAESIVISETQTALTGANAPTQEVASPFAPAPRLSFLQMAVRAAANGGTN